MYMSVLKETEYKIDSLLITIRTKIKIITRALTFIAFKKKKKME